MICYYFKGLKRKSKIAFPILRFELISTLLALERACLTAIDKVSTCPNKACFLPGEIIPLREKNLWILSFFLMRFILGVVEW